jgi:hypothetical protein
VVSDIVEGVIEFTFRVFIEIVLFYSGEIVLYVLSGGRRKPRWDYYTDESITKWMLFAEISVWIGFTFWILIIVLIVYTFK